MDNHQLAIHQIDRYLFLRTLYCTCALATGGAVSNATQCNCAAPPVVASGHERAEAAAEAIAADAVTPAAVEAAVGDTEGVAVEAEVEVEEEVEAAEDAASTRHSRTVLSAAALRRQ
jgi:hypothetical protein